jgi:hypothetical protein
VEELGRDPTVDVIVFPIGALGRGVNIVFHTDDEDDGRGAIGTIYFLTRPHPAAGDLSLMISLVAQETLAFDQTDQLARLTLEEIAHRYRDTRRQLYTRVANLLARPLSASRLDQASLTAFAANLLVPILQAIGRGMRKGMSVQVYFVDAAWAPHSANGLPETQRSSLLVIMRDILNDCLQDPDPDLRAVYQALYGIFHSAFNDISGLLLPEDSTDAGDDLFTPTPFTMEVDFSDYEPGDDERVAMSMETSGTGTTAPATASGQEAREEDNADGATLDDRDIYYAADDDEGV